MDVNLSMQGDRIGKSVWSLILKYDEHINFNGEMCLADPTLTRKASSDVVKVIVPQTDTGRQEEYSKALESIVTKELGKLTL